MGLPTRQNPRFQRSSEVNPTTRQRPRGDLWATMVQTHVAGTRTQGVWVNQPPKLSEMGTVPGSQTLRGPRVKPSRGETKGGDREHRTVH